MCPRNAISQPEFSEESILQAGFSAIQTALAMIDGHLDRQEYFELRWNYKLKKNLLKIDEFAQTAAEGDLERLLPGIEIRGEESSLDDLKFNGEVAALLDMVDGTDLLERGLGNWCSAMVLFNKERVWASLIGMPNGEVYFEHYSDAKAYVRQPLRPGTVPKREGITVAEKPDMRLRDASLAFYGQKPSSLLATTQNKPLLKVLESISKEARDKRDQPDAPRFRVYNLAGNPIMMKLIEGKIDAVIELSGQRCHDVVPGFAIALKAKASLFNIDTGDKITSSDLPNMLAKPRNKFKYVMACSDSLAVEILEALRDA